MKLTNIWKFCRQEKAFFDTLTITTRNLPPENLIFFYCPHTLNTGSFKLHVGAPLSDDLNVGFVITSPASIQHTLTVTSFQGNRAQCTAACKWKLFFKGKQPTPNRITIWIVSPSWFGEAHKNLLMLYEAAWITLHVGERHPPLVVCLPLLWLSPLQYCGCWTRTSPPWLQSKSNV